MITPKVTEVPRHLEPVTKDTFIEPDAVDDLAGISAGGQVGARPHRRIESRCHTHARAEQRVSIASIDAH
jgi:hypothetical protein